MHGGPEIARPAQLVVGPGGGKAFVVLLQVLARAIPSRAGLQQDFSRHHAGFHGGVRAFYLGEIQRPRVATDQQGAGHGHLRQGEQPPLGDGAGAVGESAAAGQGFRNHGMMFETLKLIVGAQVGIGIIQVHDQPRHHLVVLQVVEEEAAGGMARQGPA